ncbi:MAG: hypothetical protein RR348_03045, partial [Clostridia bacterium]
MGIAAKSIRKQYVVDSENIKSVAFKNILTDTSIQIDKPQEFVISYCVKKSLLCKMKSFGSQDAHLVKFAEDKLEYEYDNDGISWKIILFNNVVNGYISSNIQIECSEPKVFLDYIGYLSFELEQGQYVWSRPLPSQRTHIPAYFTALG